MPDMAATLAKLLGRTGLLGGVGVVLLRPKVRVVDARISYGQLQLKVTPTAGSGEAWVAAERVTLDATPEGGSHGA